MREICQFNNLGTWIDVYVQAGELWCMCTMEICSIMALRYFEAKVGLNKGKGGKYKHSIEVHYKVEYANIDGLLEKTTHEDDMPKFGCICY